MQTKTVSVLGGTGFLGKSVVNALLRAGYDVRVLARHATDSSELTPLSAGAGRVMLVNADITQPKTLHDALEGSDAVVNLVGILYEKGRQRFSNIHAQCPERLAKIAKDQGVKQFVHVSALGVNKASSSRYARSKMTGETAVLSAFNKAVILRPSVIFGPNDNFINQFAKMAKHAPALPLIGGGHTKFQPVYVEDVAQAVVKSLADSHHNGQVLELGGPKVYSFRQILEYIMQVTGYARPLISVPWLKAKLIGFFGEFLPKPPLTRDQVQLLKYDNVVDEDGFAKLGITPHPMELIVPRYAKKPSRSADAMRETKTVMGQAA